MLPYFSPGTYHFFNLPFILAKDYHNSEPSYSYNYPYLNIFLPYFIPKKDEKKAFHNTAIKPLTKLLKPFVKQEIDSINYPISYSKIRIVDKEWTWGTCSYKGTISFALRLFLAPPPVIRYVVVHELAHLRYKNHSKYFWKEVERYEKNYKYYDRWLNKNGSMLMLLKKIV